VHPVGGSRVGERGIRLRRMLRIDSIIISFVARAVLMRVYDSDLSPPRVILRYWWFLCILSVFVRDWLSGGLWPWLIGNEIDRYRKKKREM
jgi:hypothetical protein